MYRPEVNWDLALSTSGRLQGELPAATRPEAIQATALLRTTALRAGELAVEAAGLGDFPARHVVVSDRQGWARSAAGMAEAVLDTLGPERPNGWPREVRRAGYGLAVGAALGMISRGILGQFDAFGPRPTLHLVAPNLVRMARALPGPDEEFYLWVAVHEHAHAIQYTGIEWMRPTALRLFSSLAAEDASALDVVLDVVRRRKGLLGEDGSTALARLTALMTLSEGHADFISDRVGIPNAVKFRRRFQRQRAATGTLQRLLPMVDKNAQYTLGLAFCRAVERRVGMEGLNRAFEAPESLPTMPELRAPGKWIRRMRGTS